MKDVDIANLRTFAVAVWTSGVTYVVGVLGPPDIDSAQIALVTYPVAFGIVYRTARVIADRLPVAGFIFFGIPTRPSYDSTS